MPRNGGGVYSLPGTYEATSGETIEAQQHNDPLEDLESDMNAARPIVAGGTGATTAVGGNDALSTKGANIASAGTCDIGAATGRYVHITGTTTITAFGTKTAGVVRVLTFDGALTLTHNATSLILPGGADIVTAAGDVAVMVSEGSGNWRCVSYQRAAGNSTKVAVQTFESSGTYTPTSGMLYCIIECVGGGGGGGSAVIASVGYSFHGGGGGGGGYSRKRATAADIGASQTVTIGAGGGGGSGSGLNNGAAGGDTSVGTLCIAKGGFGGQYGSIGQLAVGGGGGVAGTGDVTATGGAGQAGVYVTSGGANNILMGGQGGNSALGAGGKAVLANSAAAAGNNGTGYGGGGAGAGANNSASASASGGDGANGIVIVTEFIA